MIAHAEGYLKITSYWENSFEKFVMIWGLFDPQISIHYFPQLKEIFCDIIPNMTRWLLQNLDAIVFTVTAKPIFFNNPVDQNYLLVKLVQF